MKCPFGNYIFKAAFALTLLLLAVTAVMAQNDAQKSAVLKINIDTGNNSYYTIYYKDTKPDDVPQEVYDGLWEVQKEVIDNFTYDYDVRYRRKLPTYFEKKEDYYKVGKGVCENYVLFFVLLAEEKGLTENLFIITGSGKPGGHAWLEYRTAENTYIIDPTWSDDYSFNKGKDTKQKFRESPAYGKQAFFITYAEDKIIYRQSSYTHSTFTRDRTETPLWEAEGNVE